jgi:hypothetical protein
VQPGQSQWRGASAVKPLLEITTAVQRETLFKILAVICLSDICQLGASPDGLIKDDTSYTFENKMTV